MNHEGTKSQRNSMISMIMNSGSDRIATARTQRLNNKNYLEVRLQPRQIVSQGATEVALPEQSSGLLFKRGITMTDAVRPCGLRGYFNVVPLYLGGVIGEER